MHTYLVLPHDATTCIFLLCCCAHFTFHTEHRLQFVVCSSSDEPLFCLCLWPGPSPTLVTLRPETDPLCMYDAYTTRCIAHLQDSLVVWSLPIMLPVWSLPIMLLVVASFLLCCHNSHTPYLAWMLHIGRHDGGVTALGNVAKVSCRWPSWFWGSFRR